ASGLDGSRRAHASQDRARRDSRRRRGQRSEGAATRSRPAHRHRVPGPGAPHPAREGRRGGQAPVARDGAQGGAGRLVEAPPRGGIATMKRRTFFGTALSAIAFGSQQADAATAVEKAPAPPPLEPLVWPVVTKLPPGIRSFAGHTDTVPDIVGRIGTPASLVIFTEGNHLMVLLCDDI